MPNIATLPQDIYTLFAKREGTDMLVEQWAKHAANMADHIRVAISDDERGPRPANTLYASEIGKPCLRQLWYKYHYPQDAEALLPHTKFKFLYGSLLEETTLALARAAGHDVSDEQRAVEIRLTNGWAIRGRIDAVIDGHVVDVKSMSPYGFGEFSTVGYNDGNDKFGYRAQVDFYASLLGGPGKPEFGYILGVDKVNGHIAAKPVKMWDSDAIMLDYLHKRTDAINDDGVPPPRTFAAEDKPNGNEGLGTACSYCEFKKKCWPGLRTFLYSNGPQFLTKVNKVPKVPEITSHDD